jgi:hypothetical protein
MRQASRQVVTEPTIKKPGKQGHDENSKYRVNEDAEESFARTGIGRMLLGARGARSDELADLR